MMSKQKLQDTIEFFKKYRDAGGCKNSVFQSIARECNRCIECIGDDESVRDIDALMKKVRAKFEISANAAKLTVLHAQDHMRRADYLKRQVTLPWGVSV